QASGARRRDTMVLRIGRQGVHASGGAVRAGCSRTGPARVGANVRRAPGTCQRDLPPARRRVYLPAPFRRTTCGPARSGDPKMCNTPSRRRMLFPGLVLAAAMVPASAVAQSTVGSAWSVGGSVTGATDYVWRGV